MLFNFDIFSTIVEGKKQLSQFMTFLNENKGGTLKDGRADNALRGVRAKREADEAG
jgi:hypothetical protein